MGFHTRGGGSYTKAETEGARPAPRFIRALYRFAAKDTNFSDGYQLSVIRKCLLMFVATKSTYNQRLSQLTACICY
jgi:hypothetical protein